jgi:hypothetical protein
MRQVDVALSHARLGQIYSALKANAEALGEFTSARGILAPLAQSSDNETWRGYLQSIDDDIAALK